MFIFLIDTDQYSGNFERRMTAYCTGYVGECGVGSEYADDDLAEKFENIIYRDDNGCERPCSIYPTPGYFNDGMGSHYKVDSDMNVVLENWKKNFIKYEEGSREDCIRWDAEDGNNRHVRELNEKIEKIKNTTIEDIGKSPAYQSVAIFFGEKPTKEQIEIIKERSQEFCKNKMNFMSGFKKLKKEWVDRQPAINIIGYRLIEEKTVKTVVELEI